MHPVHFCDLSILILSGILFSFFFLFFFHYPPPLFFFSISKETTFSPPFLQRKRRFEQFIGGTKLTAASTLAPKESDNQNVKKSGNTQFSSVSSLLNSGDRTESHKQQVVSNSHSSCSTLTFEDSFKGKRVNTDITSLNGTKCSSGKDYPLNDSLRSVNGPSPPSWTTQDAPQSNFNDLVHSSDSSSSEEPNPKFQRALGIIDSVQNPVAVADFVDSAMRMISSGDHLRRPVIPNGSKFQAEIPEWTSPDKRKNFYGGYDDSESLKWLGTRIWPMEGRRRETPVKAVGKGRHDGCSCVSPGSADCVKRHVLKKRLLLQSDIGPAFTLWKFDEMGEEAVSKSWTLEEQMRFESLVKANPLWKEANFWELALRRFPSKSKKKILSYYYNVFIPRRMSLQSKSSLETFDSDDDQADDEEPVEE